MSAETLQSASSARAWRAAIFLLPIALLFPFAGKPFQADDHVFIWVAEQIAKHPLDFFGFEVDYGVERVPIHLVNNNPPGVSYWLALIGVMTGWNLVALHVGMSLFAGLAALGMYELARDLGTRPVAAAAAGALTPAFLVSASTLMTDIPLLAAYVWAVVAWRRGFARASWKWLAVSMVCASAAPLIKLFGITLVPLLFLDGLFRSPRPRAWWAGLLIPVALFGLFQTWVHAKYGFTTLSEAASVALAEKWRTGETSATRPLLTIVFLGGSLLPLTIPAAMRVGPRPAGVAAVFAIVLVAPLMGGYSLAQLFVGQSEPYAWDVLAHVSVFLFAGLVILAGCSRGLVRMPRADAILLGSWIAGTLIFTVLLNHYISVRTLLPMLPALAVLLAPGLDRLGVRAMAIAGGFALCAWLLVADYDVAEHDRHAAQRAIAAAEEKNVALHYIAYWGFEYHLMKSGAHPLGFAEKANLGEPTRPLMSAGDLLVVDAYAAGPWRPAPKGFEVVQEIDEPYSFAATTFDARAAAGFYSHRVGVLPYRIGLVEPERFLLLRSGGK